MAIDTPDRGLRASRIAKSFGERTIFEHVEFVAQPGEPTLLIGPNGAGKTTLFDLIAGETKATEGTITFDGQPITDLPREGVRFVHQSAALLPDLTVVETIQLWGSLFDASDQAGGLVEQFGLEVVANDLVKQLSGGEQQRLRLALATIGPASLYLFDEPTNNLDADARAMVCTLVTDLAASGAVVLVATHDIELLAEVPGPVHMMLDSTLSCVRSSGDRTTAMALGDRLVEVSDFASLEQVFALGRIER